MCVRVFDDHIPSLPQGLAPAAQETVGVEADRSSEER